MPRLLSLALASIVGIGLALPAAAAPIRYSTSLIQVVGGYPTVARDINNTGQVTGMTNNTAFVTGPNGTGGTIIGTFGQDNSEGLGINSSGQVTGYYYPPGDGAFPQAFVTGPNGAGRRDLGNLGGIGRSEGRAINNLGQVTGVTSTPDSNQRAFITGPNGTGMREIGTLGGNISTGHDINNSGQVVGTSAVASDPFGENYIHAFITGPNGAGMRDLGSLGGNGQADVVAFAVNDAGQVAGASPTDNFGTHAFITGANGTGMVDLGTLGGNLSIAFDLNEAGQVVGGSTLADGSQHAFATGANGLGMVDLNSLAELPPDVFLTYAYGINDNGQVVAIGSDGNSYFLSPSSVAEPASAALVLTSLGLAGLLARRRKDGQSPSPDLV